LGSFCGSRSRSEMAEADENLGDVSNFTNDSAMMIAYERSLESSRADALFLDPLAKALAGTKGETLSQQFEAMCTTFGFADWFEFHKTWTAVRTKFIDDRVAQCAAGGSLVQLINLGAGCDTRAYRLECCKAFTGSFEVDMETINTGKAKVFDMLGNPKPHCEVHTINLDFLDKEKTLSAELESQAPFDRTKPSLFFAEGLIMYLGKEGKLKLLKEVSEAAAPGSVFILQYLDGSESEMAKEHPSLLENALSTEEATSELTSKGWSQLEFAHFGDDKLNFGRFPSDRFTRNVSFSFVVCFKT